MKLVLSSLTVPDARTPLGRGPRPCARTRQCPGSMVTATPRPAPRGSRTKTAGVSYTPGGHARLEASGHAEAPTIWRSGSNESAAGDDYGAAGMSAQEQAALRSALHSEKPVLVVHSEKAGGGIEPVVGDETVANPDFAAMRTAEELRLAVAHAEALERVHYPRKYRAPGTADPAHTIPRREANAGTKPGVLPWARPPAKPVQAWDSTQIDEAYVYNGPAPAPLESEMLRQSRPYFQTVDPVCEKILAQPPQPQDHGLYRHFEHWDSSSCQTRPVSMGSSRFGSRQGSSRFGSRQANLKLETPLLSAGSRSSILRRRTASEDSAQPTMRMPTGNPAAFKMKDFEQVWAVDTALLVADKHTASGAKTSRDGFRRDAGRNRQLQRPAPLRVLTTSSDSQRSAWSQLSPRSAEPYMLGPRSPVIRELALAMPRAKARGRNDIPLVASPPGSRGPATHGSMVHTGPRTVNTMSTIYATTQMNARGTQYAIRDTKHTQPTKAQKVQALPDELQESTRGGSMDTIPYVDLHTFDENFASPQRLTPVSARILAEEGLDTGESSKSPRPFLARAGPAQPSRL